MEDGYPSSHPIYKELDDPYEIEQYFDNIERSKAAAILRMIEIEQGEADFIDALKIYLKANPWGSGDFNVFLNAIGNIGPWTAKDFFDRWIKQANYPVLFVDLTKQGNDYYLKVNQDRHLHAEFSLFNDEFIYISPWK
jgi:aminopeptidase N